MMGIYQLVCGYVSLYDQNCMHLLYPVRVHETECDDQRSIDEHNKALTEEMKKVKPRHSLLLPLMKKTFANIRLFIQNDMSTVVEILDQYPALVRPAIVSHIGLTLVRVSCNWSVCFPTFFRKRLQLRKPNVDMLANTIGALYRQKLECCFKE